MTTRNTVQRQIILDSVISLQNHPTADEIYNNIFKTHPTISRGTVYRNLNVLSEQGKLLKIAMPDSADRFDHNTHSHYHIKCTDCGVVHDIKMEHDMQINELVQIKTGFVSVKHEIVFNGTCELCQKTSTLM